MSDVECRMSNRRVKKVGASAAHGSLLKLKPVEVWAELPECRMQSVELLGKLQHTLPQQMERANKAHSINHHPKKQ